MIVIRFAIISTGWAIITDSSAKPIKNETARTQKPTVSEIFQDAIMNMKAYQPMSFPSQDKNSIERLL